MVMPKSESVQENEMHKILWNFELQTNHQSSEDQKKKTPKMNKQTKNSKENFPSSWFCRSSGPQGENQRKRKEKQVLRPYLRATKTVEYEGDGDNNCSWCAWNCPLSL